MEQLQGMLFRLCRAPGAAGREDSAAETARELLSFLPDVKIDTMGSVVASFGNPDSDTHILLDAHIDQIGMLVTSVDENGWPCTKAMLPPRKRLGIETFYFTTNTSSMRVSQYRQNPKACI